MVLAAPVPDAPSVSIVVSPPAPRASSGERAIIASLLASGQITARDAERLVANPCLIDEVAVLALLHQRHDLTDVEYEFEKGEVLRQAR